MDNFDLISVTNLKMTITPDDAEKGFTYPSTKKTEDSDISMSVIQLSTGFILQAIPTCSCVIACGGFVDLQSRTTHLDELLSKFNETRHMITIDMEYTVGSGDDVKSGNIPIFNGIITNVSLNDVRGSTKSSKYISLTATHIFAELTYLGNSNLVWAKDNSIKSKTLTRLLSDSSASLGLDNSITINSIVDTAVNQCVPAENIQTSSVSQLIKMLMGVLLKEHKKRSSSSGSRGTSAFPGYTDDEAYQTICSRINGSATINLSHAQNKQRYRLLARNIMGITTKSNLATAILQTICTPDSGLTLVPRAVDSITICSAAPEDNSDENGNTGIDFKLIYSVNRTTSNPLTPSPDGVIVTMTSARAIENKKTQTASYVYPETDSGKHKLYVTQTLPGWLQDLSAFRSDASNKESDADDKSADESFMQGVKAYAKHVYNMIKYKDSGINIKMGLYAADAYRYLGMLFRIPRSDTDQPTHTPATDKYYVGRLTAYNFSLSLSASGGSNAVVSLTFTQVRNATISETSSKLAESDNASIPMLYKEEEEDAGTEFKLFVPLSSAETSSNLDDVPDAGQGTDYAPDSSLKPAEGDQEAVSGDLSNIGAPDTPPESPMGSAGSDNSTVIEFDADEVEAANNTIQNIKDQLTEPPYKVPDPVDTLNAVVDAGVQYAQAQEEAVVAILTQNLNPYAPYMPGGSHYKSVTSNDNK